jgi:hypothetical protein
MSIRQFLSAALQKQMTDFGLSIICNAGHSRRHAVRRRGTENTEMRDG